MQKEKELFELFKNIKERGWIPTKRHGDQCLGNAFEDLIGKQEDNLSVADFFDIEIKSHRTITNSLVTLFSKSPSYPKAVNTYLRNTYGVAEDLYGNKILNTTATGLKGNRHRGGYSYRAFVNRLDERIYLQICSTVTGEIVEENVYWSFKVLEKALEKKLKKIAIVYGEEKDENGVHYVKYTQMKLLTGLSLERMLKSIEEGELFIDIRLGVYLTGKNTGKTHDHGTAFRIKLDKLLSYGTVITDKDF